MFAISVRLSGSSHPAEGVPALQFVFPLSVGLGSYVFISALAFAAAPSRHNASQSVFLGPAAQLASSGAGYPARR
jgi:hypothetical protein